MPKKKKEPPSVAMTALKKAQKLLHQELINDPKVICAVVLLDYGTDRIHSFVPTDPSQAMQLACSMVERVFDDVALLSDDGGLRYIKNMNAFLKTLLDKNAEKMPKLIVPASQGN